MGKRVVFYTRHGREEIMAEIFARRAVVRGQSKAIA
jgi:hypothetical protein